MEIYPEFPWDFSQSNVLKHTSSKQALLFKCLKSSLENNLDILSNYKIHGVEVDIYIPLHKLAFEFQGEQHYEEMTDYLFSSTKDTKKRDTEKQKMLKEDGKYFNRYSEIFSGIHLIVIPHWIRINRR